MTTPGEQGGQKHLGIALHHLTGGFHLPGDRVCHLAGRKAHQVQHEEFPAVVGLKKGAQGTHFVTGARFGIGRLDGVDQLVDLGTAHRTFPVAVPAQKGSIEHKGAGPDPEGHGRFRFGLWVR